jgi:hypothetical protein
LTSKNKFRGKNLAEMIGKMITSTYSIENFFSYYLISYKNIGEKTNHLVLNQNHVVDLDVLIQDQDPTEKMVVVVLVVLEDMMIEVPEEEVIKIVVEMVILKVQKSVKMIGNVINVKILILVIENNVIDVKI